MSDIRAGDVVVCVDLSPQLGNAPERDAALALLRVGASYRVASCVPAGLHLVGVIPRNGYAYAPERFRKIDAADELFTEQMRACRPAKQRVPIKARGESV